MSSLLQALDYSRRSRPKSIALVQGERRVSYEELWQGVLDVGAFLSAQGITEGDRVALLMENSIEYVMAYYGTWAAGGVVVPLNTACRFSDIANFIGHSCSRYLFADARHPELPHVLKVLPPSVVVTSVGDPVSGCISWEDIPRSSYGDPSASPDSPASIIYTSGTTGKPKGVTLSHRNLSANVESIVSYLSLTENDSIIGVLPFYYSYGNSVLHTHLRAGAKVVIGNGMHYPPRILELVAKESTTGFSGVAATYNLLLARTLFEDYDLSSLRYLTQAGGAMPPATIDEVSRRIPHARFYVMFGQTEATARLCYLPPEKRREKRGAVGIPIPGVQIEIRREDGSVAEPGELGEICATGENIMLGYWQDEEATRTVLENGWLKTGDLARRDEDGYIFIEGRRSEMIKSGAHRIAPREIEEAILEMNEVAEVAVYGVPDELLGQVVGAVLVLKPGCESDQASIQRHCRNRLASFKIPKVVRFTDALPRTASGKVQRYLLADHRLITDSKGDRDVRASI